MIRDAWERSNRARTDLFLISLLLLYLELACIRWFPAHVLYLTFFTNTILLASFLGMSLGCLAAARTRRLLVYTPALLLVSMLAAQAISASQGGLESVFRVGNPLAPQLVFFGTEYAAHDPTRFIVPIEVVEAFFFLIVTLIMLGPGQELGRAFTRVPNRLEAYSLNILGSLAGITMFAVGSWQEWPPVAWFAPVAILLVYFLFVPADGALSSSWRLVPWVMPCLAGVLAVTTWTSGAFVRSHDTAGRYFWSPYYRIDYTQDRQIAVNLIGHQGMVSRDDPLRPSYAYALPHLLQRDASGPPFQDVLVIGAGSGNDVSRALAWGAQHVDAVEIDPVIQRLGAVEHPDHPYQDPRVTVHIGDGRNFLRVATGRYDLIVFALVDSLVLHSGYSNIRLESFMFTREAMNDVRAHLKPDGVFVMYNYFREGWIVARLSQGLQDAFQASPLVLTLPFVDTIQENTSGGFTILMSGNLDRLREAFRRHPAYWLAARESPSPASLNGFGVEPPAQDQSKWVRFGPARIDPPADLQAATDDWPFLYLRRQMIPDLSLRGIAIMGGLAFVLFLIFLRAEPAQGSRWRLNGQMFFLGAGFMLIETKAVVHMALLFGSTWMVNTFVFGAVLVMILGANVFAARVRPAGMTPYYVGLMGALALNSLIPLDSLLGFPRVWQVIGSSLLAFGPILFAGIIFAIGFSRSAQPDRDFGANVAGAMVGGLVENTSMLLGFQYLTLVVIAFYALSGLFGRVATTKTSA
jgi:spermidine synthase